MSEQQIRARIDAFTDAWNAHDVQAMARCFVDGGNITHPWGTFAVGRDAIERLLADEHGGPMRESRYRIEAIHFRSLSDRSAAIECDGVIEGVRAPNGSLYDLPNRVDAVVVDDGDWYFMSMNPSVVRAGG